MSSPPATTQARGSARRVVEPAGRPLLEVDDLSVDFRTGRHWVAAVRGVSFLIGANETLAMVGESGSGKSVTAFSIMRLLPEPPARISGGAIRFRDDAGAPVDLLGLPARQMRLYRGAKIAMVFQEPMTSLNPLQTVGDQIVEAICTHQAVPTRSARAMAHELLELVGVPDPARRAAQLPFEFSGGMRQRAMIAMALACRPQLLIADEPTTALDVTIQAQILELIRELQQQFGMAVLFVTHNLGIVAEIADRTIVMYAGEIVEEGPTRRVIGDPLHPYTRGLINAVPRMRAHQQGKRLRAIPGMVPPPSALPTGCCFHPRCPGARPTLCDHVVPKLEGAGAGRAVRCLRWRELAEETMLVER